MPGKKKTNKFGKYEPVIGLVMFSGGCGMIIGVVMGASLGIAVSLIMIVLGGYMLFVG